MAFVVRQRSVRNAYFGQGTVPVSRKDARKYPTLAAAQRSIASAARQLGVEQSDLTAMREPTSGIHEERVREFTPSGIDDYIKRAQPFIESGRLDAEEMEHKLQTVAHLGAVSTAAAGDAAWPELLSRALLEATSAGAGGEPRR